MRLAAAKSFCETWCPETRNWATFKQVITDHFPPKFNLSERLISAANLISDSAESYIEYARQKILKLEKFPADWVNNVLIELVIVLNTNAMVRQNLFSATISSVGELLHILSGYPKAKNKFFPGSERRSTKRSFEGNKPVVNHQNNSLNKNFIC